MDMNLIIAKNLQYLLAKNRETQMELARFMNVSTSTVSSWCKGQKIPRMDKIDRIAEHFNVTRSEIMSELYPVLVPTFNLTKREKELVTAYRAADESIRKIIDVALNLE